MLLLNRLVDSPAAQLWTMSHQDSPLPHRKKTFKYPPASVRNSHNKLNKVTSGQDTGQKPDSRTGRSNDSIVEREMPASFDSPDFDKPAENSTLFQMLHTDRKLEKESGLVVMLGKQLYLAESQTQRMQSMMSKAEDRLREKDEEIVRLKRKVREWEARFKNQDIVHKKKLQQERRRVEDSEHLYRRCITLEHKICEMEKFLADYGLVWIGDRDATAEGKPVSDYVKNCYTQLVANIEELNLAAGKGEVHVHRDKGGCGASFKTSSCMSLKFYKNGLVVQNGRLRPYEDATATSFLRDILDGYFPSELQQAYPQGVPFKVEDHRTETFQSSGSEFPGLGYRLGKVFPRSSRCGVAQRQNAKSHKPKSCAEAPPAADMMQLRSQILASHNNNCSESHVQSHINAELGLTSSGMERKREVATKDAEYHISIRERTLKSKDDLRSVSQRFMSGSRSSYHSSTDQVSGRLGSTCSEEGKSRSRSTSLPGSRVRVRSLSKGRVPSGNTSTVTSKTGDYAKLSTGAKPPRATKSATLERKCATAPLLHQINEPIGRPGELRLKVRSLNGSVVYLVHLSPDDTVARLYRLLDTCMTKTRLRGYKVVVSGYAPKRLEHLGLSLREYGILRDSVLHVVNDSAM